MTEEHKPSYTYAVEQEVSVNAFFDVQIGDENVRFQITNRYGATAEKIKNTLMESVEAYSKLRETYPRPERSTPQAAGEPQPAEKKSYEPKPVPENELPEALQFTQAEGGPMEIFKEDFDEVEIIPQPDDKANVLFHKDGLKFPLGARINKWKHNTVVSILTPLGDIDPSKPLKQRIAGTLYWSKGKEYTNAKGEKAHYRDLKLVEARF